MAEFKFPLAFATKRKKLDGFAGLHAKVSVGRPRRPRSDWSKDLWSGVCYQADEKPAENVIVKKLFKYSSGL